jgi:hypothetical protein
MLVCYEKEMPNPLQFEVKIFKHFSKKMFKYLSFIQFMDHNSMD